MQDNHFTWVDYLVLAAFLTLSSLVGVFFGFLDRKKMNSKDFLLGGGNLPWFAVAFSIQASFLSAIFILSVPVEVYNWGTMYFMLGLSYFIAMPFSAHFFLSIYYKLNVTSAYEYLEMRFDKRVRTTCALTFCIQILLYMSVVLYTPALALSQVTGLSVLWSVIICGLVCTLYTFLGGMKATVWNDFMQMIIIALTLILVIIFGLVKGGGFGEVWSISDEGGRIIFNDFRVNPTVRTTFWTQAVGGIFVILSQYASSQTTIQKFISVKTLRDAQKAIYVTIFMTFFFLAMVCLLGLIIYAYYEGCDPLLQGRIQKMDQIVPLYVMDVLGHLKGIPGLFIASIFSAALSSISGSLNALSAVTLTDFILPVFKWKRATSMSERPKAIISRALILCFGLLVTLLGFTAQFFGDVVVQMAFSIFGFVGGPLTSVLTLGMFFPFANSWGALSGLLVSLGVSSWVAVGAILSQVSAPLLPLSTHKCPLRNLTTTPYTTLFPFTTNPPIADSGEIFFIYKVSYMYYGFIAMVVCLLLGSVVSYVTGSEKEVDSRLCVDWYSWLPHSVASCLQCKVTFLAWQRQEEEVVNQKILDKIDDKKELSVYVDGCITGKNGKAVETEEMAASASNVPDVINGASVVKRVKISVKKNEIVLNDVTYEHTRL